MAQYDFATSSGADVTYTGVGEVAPGHPGAVESIEHGLAYLGDRTDLLESRLSHVLHSEPPSNATPGLDSPTVLHGHAYRLSSLAARLDSIIGRIGL